MKPSDLFRLLPRLPRHPGSLLAAAMLLALPMAAARAQTPAPTPVVASPEDAADTTTTDAADEARAKKLADTIKGFHPKQGQVALPNDLATLDVPEKFFYLDSNDTRTVLVDLWGNPPTAAKDVLGMLLPARDNQPDVRDWGVVLTFESDGYVKDGDADKIDYTDLLKKMQENTRSHNAKRQAAGYEPMELVGWAKPPRYDKAAKKLYWAKELKIGNNTEHTLNYDVRILGRRGVLSLNAIAEMAQLQEIEQASPQILAMVNFNQGHRYADFNPKTDRVAEYGLAALVAGGILAKVGGFKAILIALVAAKKFVVIGVLAVVSFLGKIFGGRGVKTHDTPSK